MSTVTRMFVLGLLFLLPVPSLAFAATQWVNVVSVGCYPSRDFCFANLDDSFDPGAGCAAGTQVRWNGNSTNGQNVLKIFIGAQLSGRAVGLGTGATACVDTKPTFTYANLQ